MQNKKSEIWQFLNSHYKKDDIIYPTVVLRRFTRDIEETDTILSDFTKQGLLTRQFTVRCPQCCQTICDIFHAADAIPDTIFCNNCDTEITCSKDAVFPIYRKT